MRGSVQEWAKLFFVFANAAVSGADYTDCFINTSQHWELTWLYLFFFTVFTVVLLLNMLIAAMAKTFDDVYEASEINSQCKYRRAPT